MTAEDLRILCTALGFTAVITQKELVATDRAHHALSLASLIESFCVQATPNLNTAANQDENHRLDEVIEQLKSDLRIKGEADMQKDRIDLLQIYDRLHQRFVSYASDDMVADHVLGLLDVELNYSIAMEN